MDWAADGNSTIVGTLRTTVAAGSWTYPAIVGNVNLPVSSVWNEPTIVLRSDYTAANVYSFSHIQLFVIAGALIATRNNLVVVP